MFCLACPSPLSRSWCASRLIRRISPLARPTSPSVSPFSMNNSNNCTASGELHSPAAQALYQPTEPLVARRTSAIQLFRWTTAVGPGPRNPSRLRVPSGRIASIPPCRRRSWIRSTTCLNPGAASRPNIPAPVAKRRSARTKCSPLVAMSVLSSPHDPLASVGQVCNWTGARNRATRSGVLRPTVRR